MARKVKADTAPTTTPALAPVDIRDDSVDDSLMLSDVGSGIEFDEEVAVGVMSCIRIGEVVCGDNVIVCEDVLVVWDNCEEVVPLLLVVEVVSTLNPFI